MGVASPEVFSVVLNEMVRDMGIYVTFYNIRVISWWSVLLLEEPGVPSENHLPQVTYKFYHIMLYRVHLAMSEIRTPKW
jgi:hypothetical protein